jgi:hypothetical protein
MSVLPIPAAISSIPFVITRLEVHVADPAGTITVSPGLARETAALTSAKEGLAATIVLVFATVIELVLLFKLVPALIVRVTG